MGKRRRERVKARRAARASRKKERSARKASSGWRARRKYKLETKRMKKLGKIDLKAERSGNRVLKTIQRATVKKTAYENKMDPNAWVGGVAKSVGSIGMALAGGSAIKGVAGALGRGGQNTSTPLTSNQPFKIQSDNKKSSGGILTKLFELLFGKGD